MARPSLLQTSFVIHAVVFAMVNSGLAYMNQKHAPDSDWSMIVLWGWGIGLAAHGAVWLLYGRRR